MSHLIRNLAVSTKESALPVMSAVTGGPAWAAAAVAGSLYANGWCKPITDTPSNRMVLNPKPYSQNVDVADMSQSFGLTATNEVTNLPGFSGTDVDEMNMSYIA